MWELTEAHGSDESGSTPEHRLDYSWHGGVRRDSDARRTAGESLADARAVRCDDDKGNRPLAQNRHRQHQNEATAKAELCESPRQREHARTEHRADEIEDGAAQTRADGQCFWHDASDGLRSTVLVDQRNLNVVCQPSKLVPGGAARHCLLARLIAAKCTNGCRPSADISSR